MEVCGNGHGPSYGPESGTNSAPMQHRPEKASHTRALFSTRISLLHLGGTHVDREITTVKILEFKFSAV